jgi:uncharacterized protein
MSRVFIDICHPADVHFFRHIINHLREKGHDVLVIARPKDVTIQLLEEFGIPFEMLGTHYSSIMMKAFHLLKRNWLIRRRMREFKPDLVMGFASPYAAQMAWISRIPCITFNDTERAFLGNTATHPFTKYLVCPEYSRFGPKKKGLRFKGIFEQLYLSDRYFSPDPTIRERLGVGKDEHYSVVRTVAWDAAHDTYPHYLNLEETQNILGKFSTFGKVFISSEMKLPDEFHDYLLPTHPSEFHHVLAGASLCVSEGAKTAAEASILGVPTILMNSANLGYLHALRDAHLLDIEPHYEEALRIGLEYLGDNGKACEDWKTNRDIFWNTTSNVPETILGYIDSLL